MVKAIRIQEKARGVGFDWDNSEQVWDKVQEELSELKTEVDKADQHKTTEEFGDLLFSLINYARFVKVNPEDALEKTNKKFILRFQYMEKQIKAKGQDMSDLSLEEMDVYWNEAKTI
jgi:XTP/dITP diphosphohydrolase